MTWEGWLTSPTVGFIRAITAVIFPVALILLRDTLVVGTRKLSFGTDTCADTQWCDLEHSNPFWAWKTWQQGAIQITLLNSISCETSISWTFLKHCLNVRKLVVLFSYTNFGFGFDPAKCVWFPGGHIVRPYRSSAHLCCPHSHWRRHTARTWVYTFHSYSWSEWPHTLHTNTQGWDIKHMN